jgi:hypothetical protein
MENGFNKHAYLIIAHQDFDILIKTLSLLDDERNDFFIHIDKKSGAVDTGRIYDCVKKSKLILIDRINVYWGGYSQIECELLLLKTAVAYGKYSYFHLLSGADLPIKPTCDIYNFFENSAGSEFIEYAERADTKFRYKYFHKLKYKNAAHANKISCKILRRGFQVLQMLVGINRVKKEKRKFMYGSNWFSITCALAEFVLSQEEWIKKTFKSTLCCDEIFLQTVVYNSDFLAVAVNDNKRFIDWERGNPYVFKKDDFDALMRSDRLFARKFDLKTDSEIIQMIFDKLFEENKTNERFLKKSDDNVSL